MTARISYCSLALSITLSTLAQSQTQPPPRIEPAALVKELGADNFKARENAYRLLRSIGEDARGDLHIGAKSADLEQARRCQRLLELLNAAKRKKAIKLVDDTFPGKIPYIDMIWTSRDGVIDASGPVASTLYTYAWPYYESAAPGLDVPGFSFGRYRMATRDMLIDLAEQGAPKQALEWIVAEMLRREAAWFEKYHPAPPAPEKLP